MRWVGRGEDEDGGGVRAKSEARNLFLFFGGI